MQRFSRRTLGAWLMALGAGALLLSDRTLLAAPPVAAAPPAVATPAAPPAKKADPAKSDEAQRRRDLAHRQLEMADRRRKMLEQSWVEAREHTASIYERCAPGVKAAFRDTVAATRKSTVRVLADGKQVALGAVVRADGLVVTKKSELRGKLQCELSDGRRVDAETAATDDLNDLALLRLPAKDLTPVVWISDSKLPESQVAVGSWLATCGVGTDPVAVGVVSVTARAISPPRGVLGVLLADDGAGARVDEVLPGSAAAEAGLQSGDVIVELNGQKVAHREEMVSRLSKMQAGDKVRLKIARDSERLDRAATLGTMDMGGLRTDRFQMMNLMGGPLSQRRAGFTAAIQHDTVLLPQDCGGPVVDIDGHVVGLNIARAGRVDSYALPAAVVKKLVDKQPAAKSSQAVSHKAGVQ
ncbi:MAG: S1C family serine protease [Planctomycetia bacterium]|nr:S1C family serine protease [Planctomycetia bacterium]